MKWSNWACPSCTSSPIPPPSGIAISTSGMLSPVHRTLRNSSFSRANVRTGSVIFLVSDICSLSFGRMQGLLAELPTVINADQFSRGIFRLSFSFTSYPYKIERSRRMSEREAYIEKAKARIDQWNADIEKLQAKVDEAEAKIKEIADSGDDAWDDMKAGFDSAWDNISDAFNSAMSRFR